MSFSGELRKHGPRQQHLFGNWGVFKPGKEPDSRNMAVLDNQAHFGRTVPCFKLFPGSLVGGIASGSFLLVFGAVLARGFSENGFRLGSQLAWRYGSFIFFLALVGGPLCRIGARLFPRRSFPGGISRELVWGFCASYGIYLLSVFIPNIIHPSLGTTLMVLFGGGVALMMAVTAAPLARLDHAPIIASKIRRVLLGICAAYFWLCYSLTALARIYGPHRPDHYYGISLCLMIAALLVRYADRWFVPRQQEVAA